MTPVVMVGPGKFGFPQIMRVSRYEVAVYSESRLNEEKLHWTAKVNTEACGFPNGHRSCGMKPLHYGSFGTYLPMKG